MDGLTESKTNQKKQMMTTAIDTSPNSDRVQMSSYSSLPHEGEPGAVAFVPKGTVHRFRCIGNSTGRLLLVYTPGGIEGFFRESGIPAGGDGPAPSVSSAEIARTEKAGLRYGLQVVDWAH
jgi:hypothetical protein